MIIINEGKESEAFEDIKEFSEEYARKQGLGKREKMQMNLVMEEMVEITRMTGNAGDRCFNIDGDEHLCTLTMELSPGTVKEVDEALCFFCYHRYPVF